MILILIISRRQSGDMPGIQARFGSVQLICQIFRFFKKIKEELPFRYGKAK